MLRLLIAALVALLALSPLRGSRGSEAEEVQAAIRRGQAAAPRAAVEDSPPYLQPHPLVADDAVAAPTLRKARPITKKIDKVPKVSVLYYDKYGRTWKPRAVPVDSEA